MIEEVIVSSIGHIEIRIAIVVIVTRHHSFGETNLIDSRSMGHILKRPVPSIAIQNGARARTIREGCLHGVRVYEIDVEAAVIVKVEESDTAAHAFDDILLVG